ncbi:MAG: aminoglycoside phosphotransferase family protein [Chloroflexota bacterium]
MSIPEAFARTMVELYGPAGAAWLERLPTLIGEYEQRWSLTVGRPFPNLSYNYVAPAARADGTQVVLKLGVVNPELLAEIEALRLYDGRGCARLLAADAAQGSLLLEQLQPGTPLTRLAEVDDEQSTTIAAQVMRALWRPLPANHPFPTTAKWAAGLQRLRATFNGDTGPFPAALVETAEHLFAELLASSAEPVLLHGDLHHDNILAAERQPWLALDPKGLAGEPAYEVGALLRNPSPQYLQWPDAGRLLSRRLDQLAESLGFERERLWGWSLAQAVLSAWWSYEDHGRGWEEGIACAELLAAMRRGRG